MRSPTTLLQHAWSHVKSHFQLFATIYAVPAALGVFFVALFGSETKMANVEPSQMGIFFVSMIVIAVVNIMMGIAMIRAISSPETFTFQSAYGYAKQMFFPYLWVAILTGAAVMVGFILLIIPGIIFMVWFAFSYMVLLLENKRGTEALTASKSYVSGKWWAVFGRILFLALIMLIVSAAFGFIATMFGGASDVVVSVITMLANFVLVPLAITYMYFMYQDVKSGAGVSETPVTNSASDEAVSMPGQQTQRQQPAPQASDTPAEPSADDLSETESDTTPKKENTTQGYGQ